ncbi:MAG: endolytic transglycosylase MltG [Burkholderiales bacterium]|nr:endolytic transglycosylase MltG [Burkholderiales bacterium]
MVKRLVGFLLVLALVVAAGAGWYLWQLYTQPLAIPGASFAYDVRQGATLAAVARDLGAAGVLPQPLALVAIARGRGVDRAIKAGSYEIEAGTTLPRLLAKLTQGDVTQTSVVVIEGSTFADMKQVLRTNAAVKNTLLDLPDAEIMARLGAPGLAPEGRFFPDTYFFAAGSTDAAILGRAKRALDRRLAAGWEQRATGLPYKTPEEALIVASIVEKETGKAADRPLIASVFVNRLRKGMRLQSDPTTIYGMGTRFDGDLRRRDLDSDTPFNTYTRDGLPPTPIALVSQAALDATLDPPTTDFLYFVARGDGTSQFSATLPEHNRAVSRFQRGGK